MSLKKFQTETLKPSRMCLKKYRYMYILACAGRKESFVKELNGQNLWPYIRMSEGFIELLNKEYNYKTDILNNHQTKNPPKR